MINLFMIADLKEEKKLWGNGFKIVVGLDEAGRGPLAGPVIAAAVYLKNVNAKAGDIAKLKLRDSKQLTEEKRDKFYGILTACREIGWGIGVVSEKIIDKINIKNASELAMEKALNNLNYKLKIVNLRVEFLIIDGSQLKNAKLKNMSHKLIVKGDEKVFSCAAASILAKVTRDRIMRKYHKKYPVYGFNVHKGYPTAFHRNAIYKYGPCPIHRMTFSGVAK